VLRVPSYNCFRAGACTALVRAESKQRMIDFMGREMGHPRARKESPMWSS
jgi:hypothetical protein